MILACATPLYACGGGATPAQSANSENAAQTQQAPKTDPSATTTTTDVSGNAEGTRLAPSTPETASTSARTTGTTGEGEANAEAGRTKKDIQALVRGHREEARACYDTVQQKHPSTEGNVTIAWTIDAKGNVKEAHVEDARSTIRDENLSSCLVSLFKNLKFPVSAKGFETHAVYPFNFHPKAARN
jgi:hypothetical protein